MPRLRRHSARLPLLWLIVWIAWQGGGLAQPQLTDSVLKAKYLMNFLHHATWKAGSSQANASQITVAMYCSEEEKIEFRKSVTDLRIGDKPVVVVEGLPATDLSDIHMVYIGRDHRSELNSILLRTKEKGILTVGDIRGMIDDGGILNFVRVGDRIRFEVNLERAQEEKITLSSNMIRLATRVKK